MKPSRIWLAVAYCSCAARNALSKCPNLQKTKELAECAKVTRESWKAEQEELDKTRPTSIRGHWRVKLDTVTDEKLQDQCKETVEFDFEWRQSVARHANTPDVTWADVRSFFPTAP